MKRIGDGSNIVLVISFLTIALFMCLIAFTENIAIGCLAIIVTTVLIYLQSRLRQIDLDRDSIVVTNLLWRKTRISIHEVVDINQTIHPFYALELKNENNIHFRLPSHKSFPYNILTNLNEEKQDHIYLVLDKIDKLKRIYPETKNTE